MANKKKEVEWTPKISFIDSHTLHYALVRQTDKIRRTECFYLFILIQSLLIHRHFSTALTWSQCEDSITLHALPTTHCTNIIETSAGGIYHTDLVGGYDYHGGSVGGGASSGVGIGIEDVAGDDFDYAMDCGDFIF